MGLFTKDIKTMEDMFLRSLQDNHYAEHQIAKALPQMIEQATNRDLSAGLTSHLEETQRQIGRLEQVFKKLARSLVRPTARRSTGSSRKLRRPPAKSTTRRSSTRPS